MKRKMLNMAPSRVPHTKKQYSDIFLASNLFYSVIFFIFTWYILGEHPSGVSLLRNIRAAIVLNIIILLLLLLSYL